jgi:hypothetical protein
MKVLHFQRISYYYQNIISIKNDYSKDIEGSGTIFTMVPEDIESIV